MSDTCTINDTFAGYPLGDCGQPAVATVSWLCPHGHAETTPVCARHVEDAEDVSVWCATCAEAGAGGRRMAVEMVSSSAVTA